MPRQVQSRLTMDAVEDEIVFTVVALTTSPDAAGLVPEAQSMLVELDAFRIEDRQYRTAIATVDVQRVMANHDLDGEVIRFGDDLLLDVGKDRSSPRFTTFFPKAPSVLVREPLSEEVTRVEGWIASSSDPVLLAHKEPLTRTSSAARAAVTATAGIPLKRAERDQKWEALCASFTERRDALHRKLAEIAREKGLSREWPDLFFRVG